jgi:hypothetical protein
MLHRHKIRAFLTKFKEINSKLPKDVDQMVNDIDNVKRNLMI